MDALPYDVLTVIWDFLDLQSLIHLKYCSKDNKDYMEEYLNYIEQIMDKVEKGYCVDEQLYDDDDEYGRIP